MVLFIKLFKLFFNAFDTVVLQSDHSNTLLLQSATFTLLHLSQFLHFKNQIKFRSFL